MFKRMISLILVVMLILILGTVGIIATSCGNRDMIDTVYTYDKAIITIGDEQKTINIKKWRDYEDGDQLQITATDGTVYLVSAYNCVLIKNAK